MADVRLDILAATTDLPAAVEVPTIIDADEFDRARLDDRWRQFCLDADRYVAATTRPPVQATQPVSR